MARLLINLKVKGGKRHKQSLLLLDGVKTTSIPQFEPHTTSMTLLHHFTQALHDLPLVEITTTAYAKYKSISNVSLNGQVKLLKTLSSLLDTEFTLRVVFIPGIAFLKGVVGVKLLLTPKLSLYRLFFYHNVVDCSSIISKWFANVTKDIIHTILNPSKVNNCKLLLYISFPSLSSSSLELPNRAEIIQLIL